MSEKVGKSNSDGQDEKKKQQRKRKRKKPSKKLPKELVAVKNLDKGFHESWKLNADLLDFPHPFRGVLLGPPNCGKTTTVKNILLRQRPHFQRMYLLHCDPGFTQEYKDVEAVALADFPSPDQWPGKEKTLVVVDDVELKTITKVQRKSLDRLFGFVSTHKNISVLLCAQDPFNVPAIVRRCSNLWVLWPSRDVDSVQVCARKCGVDLKHFFGRCSPRDSIWIDLTDHTPAKLRMNGYQIIDENSLNGSSITTLQLPSNPSASIVTNQPSENGRFSGPTGSGRRPTSS
jgi:hypothetical protein